MKTYHLRAVLVRVTKGDKVVTTQAFGPSMTGVPATPAMHFRNGAVAVAFAYVATLLMESVAVGTGKLLSRSSYHAMTDSNLLGFGHKQANCVPSCFKQIPAHNFGLGVVKAGSWILQNPLLSGWSSTEAYLPSQKIAIAVAATFKPRRSTPRGLSPTPATRSSGRLAPTWLRVIRPR